MRNCIPVLIASAGLIGGCTSSGEGLSGRIAACEIVTDYVQRFVSDAERFRAEYPDAPRGVAVSETPYQLLPVLTKDGPIDGVVPDVISTVEDWEEITKLSSEGVLEKCPELKSWLNGRVIIADDAEISSLTKGDEWEANIIWIALPVFTEDRKNAVVFASKGAGGLAGVGMMAVYSKDEGGERRLVGEKTRWIS